jgi:hypothetical protein
MTSLAAPGRRRPASPLYNLGIIALGCAVLGLAAAYALDAAGRTSPTPAGSWVTIVTTVAGRELAIPRAWFRHDEQAVEGFADQVELEIDLPIGADGGPAAIEVTLIPRSRARPSSSLLDGVYLHQFAPEELSGPPGLVGKPLLGKEGFAGETVWYDALSADPFVAKCMVPVVEEGPTRCIRTVFYEGIAAVYAFDAEVLPRWRDFDPAIEAKLAEMGIS